MSATAGRKAPVLQPAPFPRYERLALRAIGINEFVWLRDAPVSPGNDLTSPLQ